MKLCLGFESTAHTIGVSVVSFDGVVLSNERKLFTTSSGGLIPVKVAEHHCSHVFDLVSSSLSKAGVSISDISLIAFSQSPGIGHCLRIGAIAARSLAALHGLPLVGVNHCIAHLEIGRLLGKKVSSDGFSSDVSCSDPILLYASGANTQVIGFEGGKYRVFGETLDIGIGNFLDSFARSLDLGFPGGPKVEVLARKGSSLIDLPYSVKGMDVSFAGLVTKLSQLAVKGCSHEDLCFSAQEYVFAMIIEVAERALAHTGKSELVLGGGVACNKRLQEMAFKMCEDRGASCFIVDNEFNVDNAAMIAWTGILQFSAGDSLSLVNSGILPYVRTDDIEVSWR